MSTEATPRRAARLQRPETTDWHLGERLRDDDVVIGLWVREDLKALEDWEEDAMEVDDPGEQPKPTAMLSEREINAVVAEALRGPMGHPGPTGATGPSA